MSKMMRSPFISSAKEKPKVVARPASAQAMNRSEKDFMTPKRSKSVLKQGVVSAYGQPLTEKRRESITIFEGKKSGMSKMLMKGVLNTTIKSQSKK